MSLTLKDCPPFEFGSGPEISIPMIFLGPSVSGPSFACDPSQHYSTTVCSESSLNFLVELGRRLCGVSADARERLFLFQRVYCDLALQ